MADVTVEFEICGAGKIKIYNPKDGTFSDTVKLTGKLDLSIITNIIHKELNIPYDAIITITDLHLNKDYTEE
jgi:hypothetical protein